jgi:hypothetical protein
MADEAPEDLPPEVETGVAPGERPDLPPPVPFTEVDTLPDKPATDVKIRLDDGSGLEFRERMIRQETVATSVAGDPVAPAGFNFRISNALLGADGKVAADPATGALKIVPASACHEMNFTGERLAGMTVEAIQAEVHRNRGIAAAKALNHFQGMDKGAAIFGDRLAPIPADPGAMPEA